MQKNNIEITKVCDMCENAVCIHDENNVLCRRKGVVNKGYSCRRFSYDPLKRTPQKRRELSLPDLEEMKI